MKLFVLFLLSLTFTVPVQANDDYPGQAPNWNQRFSVSCTMSNNRDGTVSYEFAHRNVDYAQAGSMMVYLQRGMEDWYSDLRALGETQGADTRLIPDTGGAGSTSALEQLFFGDSIPD